MIAATFSQKEDVMPVNFWVSAQTLMPICRTEKARFTSLPVRPFTSLEAAQSSRIMGVLVPSESHLTSFNHFSTVCCLQTIIHSWIVFAKRVVGLVRERQADEHDVVELSTERAVDLVHHEPRFA